MARILDFYAVRWEYEPVTFPILWNTDGDVVESFSPDFYLPELDLFLEMTTLKQKLVRKKNRKLRRLRELYPDIRIKLFYARDFRAIMLKYGKLALVDSLSGAIGQVVPERDRDVAPGADQIDPAVDRGGVAVSETETAQTTVLETATTEPEEPRAVPGDEVTPRRRSRSGSERRRRRRAAQAANAARLESLLAPAIDADGEKGRPA